MQMSVYQGAVFSGIRSGAEVQQEQYQQGYDQQYQYQQVISALCHAESAYLRIHHTVCTLFAAIL